MRKFRNEGKKKIFLEILKYLAFICISMFVVYFIEVCIFGRDLSLTNNWLISHRELFFISVVIVTSTMTFLYSLSCRFMFSAFLPSVAFGIYGFANRLKISYRSEPILPEELSYLFNLKELLGYVTKVQLFLIVVALIFLIAGIVVLLKFTKKTTLSVYYRVLCGLLSFYIMYSYVNYHGNLKYFNIIYFGAFLIFAIVHFVKMLKLGKSDLIINKPLEYFKLIVLLVLSICFLYFWGTNPMSVLIRKYSAYPEGNYNCSNFKEDSVLTGFITFNFKEIVTKPLEYDLDMIYDKYTNKAVEINSKRESIKDDSPNVIIVMSESFSDMKIVNNFELAKNPIEKYDLLAKKNVNGSTYAKGIGGSTNTSEYEVITGFDTASFKYKNVFSNVAKRDVFPSIVSTLEDIGYKSAAIHFNNPSFYSRDEGYGVLGFDEFYNDRNYENVEYIAKSPYVSDKSNFDLIYNIISDTEEPVVLHNVTIQNHGPYMKNYYDKLTNTAKGLTNYSDDEASTYATGIEITSNELDKLLKKLDTFKEPTIVLFFGDHLPYFYGENNFEGTPYITKHQVPYMLYSNYDKFKGDEELVGMSFLYSKMFSVGNYKTTPFNAFMEEVNSKVAAIGNGGVFTDFYTFVPMEKISDPELLELLKEYQAIMYDTTEGKQELFEKGFFDIIE